MAIPVQTVDRLEHTEADGRVYQDYVRRFEIDVTALPADFIYRIPVETGKTVLDVRTITTTALEAGSTVKVGDLDDDDGYMVATDVVAVNTMKHSRGTFADDGVSGIATYLPYSDGKHYAATSQILLTFNKKPTDGVLVAEVVFDGYFPTSADM